MTKQIAFVAALSLFAALSAPAAASTVTLTFQGLQNEEPVANYYDGGTGGFGSGPGPNYGISFESNSLAVISTAAGGTGNFSNVPGGNTTALYFLNGTADVLNDPAGFTTGFSFDYSAAIAGVVDVYSKPNGTGTLLASLTLPETPFPASALYSVWSPEGVTFSGTAESVAFSGSADFIAFDNVTLGSSIPGGSVSATPLPTTLPLFGAALAGLLGYAGLRKRQQIKARR